MADAAGKPKLKPHEIPGHRFYVDKATAPVHWHKLPMHKAYWNYIKTPQFKPFFVSLCVTTVVLGFIIPSSIMNKESREASKHHNKKIGNWDYYYDKPKKAEEKS